MMTIRFARHVGLLAAITLFAACDGNGPVGPASNRNNVGTGSGTLLITADVEVEDESSGGYITHLSATIRDQAGSAVSGATVQVNAAGLGVVSLTETQIGSGTYTATRTGAPSQDVRLDVTRGSDNVARVIVGSPGLHRITAPASGSTIPDGEPVSIRWTVPRRALTAEIETRDVEVDDLVDNGAYALPGALNPARVGQRIRVYRFNEVTIAGGRTGSRLRIRVRDTVEPITVQ